MKLSLQISPLCFGLITILISTTHGWGSDKVLLSDISVLTLKNGAMTTGRRSSPVQQVSCVGGNAKGAYIPQVVQCYNRGSDGNDIQWECKTDMDNAYRFGAVEVSCEGYDYSDDPYVLKGSCGLEYTLEYTKEGLQQQQQRGGGHHNYYGDDQGSYYSTPKKSSGLNPFGDLIMLAIVGIIIYAIYHTCIRTPDRSAGPDPQRPDRPRGSPPPYGWRGDNDGNDGNDGNGGDSCSGSRGGGTYSSGPQQGARPQAGGWGNSFWTGLGTGGLLGYMFGGRGTQTQYGRQPYGYGGGYGNGYGGGYGSGFGSMFGGGGGGMFGGGARHRPSGGGMSFGGGGGSTGTRAASGFGGTKRR